MESFRQQIITLDEMAQNNAPLPAVPAADAAAFDIVAFDGRRRLQEIHELLTSFLDYQSHIRSHAAMALPPTIPRPSEDQRHAIVNLLTEENANFQVLQELMAMIKKENTRMIKKYDDRPAAWEQQEAFGDNANNGWGQQQN